MILRSLPTSIVSVTLLWLIALLSRSYHIRLVHKFADKLWNFLTLFALFFTFYWEFCITLSDPSSFKLGMPIEQYDLRVLIRHYWKLNFRTLSANLCTNLIICLLLYWHLLSNIYLILPYLVLRSFYFSLEPASRGAQGSERGGDYKFDFFEVWGGT